MPRALITGITGQDGYYLSEHLLKQGYEVYGLIRGQANPKLSTIERTLPDVRIVDSGNAVARRAREVLVQSGLLRGLGREPTLEVQTTGDPLAVQPIVQRMLGQTIAVTPLSEFKSALPV